MTEQLREGQRVQLNLEAMKPHRREVYSGQGPGVITRLTGERALIQFDSGWHSAFFLDEVEPAVEQIGLFADDEAPNDKRIYQRKDALLWRQNGVWWATTNGRKSVTTIALHA